MSINDKEVGFFVVCLLWLFTMGHSKFHVEHQLLSIAYPWDSKEKRLLTSVMQTED